MGWKPIMEGTAIAYLIISLICGLVALFTGIIKLSLDAKGPLLDYQMTIKNVRMTWLGTALTAG
jgi:hypothetical protein